MGFWRIVICTIVMFAFGYVEYVGVCKGGKVSEAVKGFFHNIAGIMNKAGFMLSYRYYAKSNSVLKTMPHLVQRRHQAWGGRHQPCLGLTTAASGMGRT